MMLRYSLRAAGLLLALTARTGYAQTFAPVVNYQVVGTPFGVVASDLNRDGKLDLVAVSSDGGSCIRVLAGNGDGTFRPAQLYSSGGGGYTLAAADLNGDSWPDVVLTHSQGNSVSVLLNKRDGTLADGVYYDTGTGHTPWNLALADVNADGKPDIVTTSPDGNSAGVLLGNGNGTFRAVVHYSTGTGSKPQAVAVGDVNNDGKPDLLVANQSSYSVGVLLGNGNGTFQPVTTTRIGAILDLATADLNGDGKLDVVLVDYTYTGHAGVLLGNGDGTFQPLVTYLAGFYPEYLALADINSDQRPDIVTAGNDGSVLLGNGDGTFRPAVRVALGASIAGMTAADLNGDNRADIAIGKYALNQVGVALNQTAVLAATPAAEAGQLALYPNPTAGSARLAYSLPAAAAVSAEVLDALGQRVCTLAAGLEQTAGSHTLALPALAPGMYVVRLQGGGVAAQQRLLVQ